MIDVWFVSCCYWVIMLFDNVYMSSLQVAICCFFSFSLHWSPNMYDLYILPLFLVGLLLKLAFEVVIAVNAFAILSEISGSFTTH